MAAVYLLQRKCHLEKIAVRCGQGSFHQHWEPPLNTHTATQANKAVPSTQNTSTDLEESQAHLHDWKAFSLGSEWSLRQNNHRSEMKCMRERPYSITACLTNLLLQLNCHDWNETCQQRTTRGNIILLHAKIFLETTAARLKALWKGYLQAHRYS